MLPDNNFAIVFIRVATSLLSWSRTARHNFCARLTLYVERQNNEGGLSTSPKTRLLVWCFVYQPDLTDGLLSNDLFFNHLHLL